MLPFNERMLLLDEALSGETAESLRDKLLSYGPFSHDERAAYIITSNRGRRYLAFAGSVEHQNAAMFGYKMEALYA